MEDEETDVLFMQRAFTSLGLASLLHVVEDGRTAIDYLSGTGVYGQRELHPVPALILLDLNLPGVRGLEVLKWIREHREYAKVPVIIFSGTTHESDRKKARELSATDFIQKPASGLKFTEVVRDLQEKWL